MPEIRGRIQDPFEDMRKPLIILLTLLGWSCAQYGQLTLMSPMPRRLNETSGMVTFDGRTVWIVEDGSNPDQIREVDTTGNLIRAFEVSDAKNIDWEALTRDTEGNIYIGDFGNNQNDRDNLRIYRLPDPREEKGDKIPSETIHFTYPDQKDFPPAAEEFRFDAEALFHSGSYLYILIKNRSRPFDGTARVYRVPDRAGTYVAEAVTQLNLCEDRRSCQVTDAALSPNGRRLVLLGYGNLWVFEDFDRDGFGSEPRRIALQTNTQLEGICFASESLLYLADEISLGRGGNLYSFPLPEPKK